MKQKFFKIPVSNSESVEADINAFYDQHRISHIDKHFVAEGENSFWAICITWSENEGSLAGSKAKHNPKTTARIDYKEVLNDDDFILYCRLRDLRKETAEKAGVAPYNVFTNEQLAAIVQHRISSQSALTEIAGIGKTRASKYGEIFIECLQTLLQSNN